jgi:hypothetical protein
MDLNIRCVGGRAGELENAADKASPSLKTHSV